MMTPRTTFHVDTVRRRRPKHEEQSFQQCLVRDLRRVLAPGVVFFHVPNGGQRTGIEGAILNGMGVLAGVPDLIFIHGGRASGLELKGKSGSLKPDQRAVHVALRNAGMRVEVARNTDEALEMLREMGVPLRIKEDETVSFGQVRQSM